MAKNIRIVSTVEGFRRCGVAHSKAASLYQMDRFNKKELETLQTEPTLIVDEVDVKEEAPAGDDGKGKTGSGAKK